MLSTNKPSMDNKLKKLYNVFEDAAYEAFLKSEGYDDVDSQIDDLELQNKPNKSEIKKKMEDTAKTFSDEFVKQLKDGKVLETISDEIDKHVKSIKLMISVPTLLPTIISPMGPCTGALTISEETGAQINLL